MWNVFVLLKVAMRGAGITAILIASPALAQESHCETRDQAGFVAVLICPPGLEQEAWKDAGKAACGSRRDCQGWIWEDATKAPEAAPETPTDLTQEQITSSVDIWVNGNQSLIVIEKVE